MCPPGGGGSGEEFARCVEPPPAPHRPRPQPRRVPPVEKLWSDAAGLHHPSHSTALATGLQGRKQLLRWQQGQGCFFPCLSLGRSSSGSREGGGEQRCAFQPMGFYMEHVGRGAPPAPFRVGGGSLTQCTVQAEHASYLFQFGFWGNLTPFILRHPRTSVQSPLQHADIDTQLIGVVQDPLCPLLQESLLKSFNQSQKMLPVLRVLCGKKQSLGSTPSIGPSAMCLLGQLCTQTPPCPARIPAHPGMLRSTEQCCSVREMPSPAQIGTDVEGSPCVLYSQGCTFPSRVVAAVQQYRALTHHPFLLQPRSPSVSSPPGKKTS